MKNEIRKLIIDAQEGDAEAFHQLVARHDEKVMTLAYQLMHNQQDAEDLYQEVFLKVYKNLSRFRFESEFYTWLYRIMVNTAYNFKRQLARLRLQEPAEDLVDDQLHWIADPDSNPVHQQEIREAIERATATLPPKQRSVFILKHQQNLKLKEVARIMGISEGTVKKYLFRAMEKLRTELKEYHYA